MKLTRYQRFDPWLAPLEQFNTLREEINRLFDTPFRSVWGETDLFEGWTPALDIFEAKDSLVVKAEVPGMKKEDIELTLHENTLTLSGERKSERKEGEGSTFREERFLGRFQRTVTLPKPVAAAGAKASYSDGILTITLPKADEAKPKQIAVNVN